MTISKKTISQKNVNPINFLNLRICNLNHKIRSILYKKTMKLNPKEWNTEG